MSSSYRDQLVAAMRELLPGQFFPAFPFGEM